MRQPSRVLFLYTGGTMGMVPSPRGFEAGPSVESEVRAALADRTDIAADFDHIEHVIDSSDVTPEDWQSMVDHLWQLRESHDAFIVLHGTNTLAHSGSAVAYALPEFGKPVVFTGSQVPFGQPGSDASANINGAVDAVVDGDLGTVGLFFDGQVFAACRATKVSTIDLQGFYSPHAGPLPWRTLDAAPSAPSAASRAGEGARGPARYRRHDVPVITAAPGMRVERFRAMTTPAPDAVIYRAYGSGEGPSEEPGVEHAVRQLVQGGTPVVVMSQSLHARVDLSRYAAAEFLARAGAVGAADMTLEAVYTKLIFLLSQGIRGPDLVTWLLTNLIGEISPADEPVGPRLHAGPSPTPWMST